VKEIQLISDEITKGDWEIAIQSLPNPHILQSWEWGKFKTKYGWSMHPYLWQDENRNVLAGAMCLRRYFSLPGLKNTFSVCYVPKGPLLNWKDENLRTLVLINLFDKVIRKSDIFVKIDPELIVGIGEPGKSSQSTETGSVVGASIINQLQNNHWVYSKEQVQFKNTIIVDLTPSEDQLLANMKQKTRYNIRLAEKNGVVVRVAAKTDLDELFKMYAETSIRNGFAIRNREYYITLWSSFLEEGLAVPLTAYVDNELVAGLILFCYHNTAMYFYGMSLVKHREKMPNYLLQWEAMKYAKSLGCTRYDFWGAPNIFNNDDPMIGVYRFKSGFGGDVYQHIGAWDYPFKKFMYKSYTEFVPKILDIYRWKGFNDTREIIE